jgi:hypothetical protein
MRTPDLLRRLLLLVVLAGLAPSPAAAQTQHAVRADTLYTMTGDGPIVDGVVLIEGSTIAEVGPAADVDIPADATVHEATVATPGLIDPRGTVGVSGLENVPANQDQLDTSAPIQPHLRAIDAYNPREDLVHFVRQLGITTVHTGHAPGALVSGQTATFSTTGGTVGEALRDSLTTVAFTLGPDAQARFESPGTARRPGALRVARHAAEGRGDAATGVARRPGGDGRRKPDDRPGPGDASEGASRRRAGPRHGPSRPRHSGGAAAAGGVRGRPDSRRSRRSLPRGRRNCRGRRARDPAPDHDAPERHHRERSVHHGRRPPRGRRPGRHPERLGALRPQDTRRPLRSRHRGRQRPAPPCGAGKHHERPRPNFGSSTAIRSSTRRACAPS